MIDNDKIIKVNIDSEMRTSFIDYSMSVIVSRALPDVRDGMKPVHRRVLFGMNELGNTSDKPTKKSARVVGEVMGKYHPHGDSSIYGTVVRLAQPWAMRYPLVFGQGNFGSMDNDPPAAARYTEVKLTKLAEEMLRDIEKDTVDMQFNFDDSLKEPTVLPTRLPNLLLNGANGIAVGMATNMPTHNLTEVIDGCVAYIDNPDIDIDGLMQYIKAPDFPTGGIIYGYEGVKEAFHTGRGRIIIRAHADIEVDKSGREKIIITDIPYGVVKSDMVKSIGDLVSEKKIDGISDIVDLSKSDVRIEIDVKREANARVVLNKLYKYTQLEYSFSVNNVALVHGRPYLLNLRDLVKHFVDHRMDVVTRRTQWELREAERRAHILEGLIIAVDNIDEVVRIIRANRTPALAQTALEERFNIDNLQSKAIVDMRLAQLTGLRVEELRNEYAEIEKKIDYLHQVLASEQMRFDIIKTELVEIRDKYGDERRTEIQMFTEKSRPDDFYADDDMVITISHNGYIKRTDLREFNAQGRGGVGSKGSATREEDFIEYIHAASMRSTMMFFTEKGRLYWLKVYDIPEFAKNSKGRAIQNILNLDSDNRVTAVMNVKGLDDKDFVENHYLVFATKDGIIKKTTLEAFSRPRQMGVNAINLREGDKVVSVCLTDGQSEIVIANREGRAIRFPEEKVRPMGRTATGVKAMALDGDDDCVVGMVCVPKDSEDTIVVVSENGFGKRSRLDDEDGQPIYRVTNRGGKGVKTINVTEKTGKLIAINLVNDSHDLMIINKSGITIRLHMDTIRVMGRATQGVKLIDLQKRNDSIAFVCRVDHESDDNVEEQENEVNETSGTDIANNEQQE